MKKKKNLDLWQMLILVGLSVILIAGIFIPIASLNDSKITDLETSMQQELNIGQSDFKISEWTIMTMKTSNKTIEGIGNFVFAKVALWILNIMTVLFLAYLIVSFFLKWNKRIGLGIICGISSCHIALLLMINFSIPKLFANISGLDSEVYGEQMQYYAEMIWKTMRTFWLWGFIIICVLLLASAITFMFIGSSNTSELNRTVGKMIVVNGELYGAEIPLNSQRLFVGRDPERCQLVISNPRVSRTHFDIFYSLGEQLFNITCYSDYGAEIFFEGMGKRTLQKGMSLQVKKGTEISIDNGNERFRLL